MKVSVIIPVYNAEKYLKEAVESAVSQKETGEIILVEDCSPDNSLEECGKLADKYEKVKLYRHPDKGNHGAGATRNLGIKKASFEYIAFLDADDYYLPDRFKNAKKIFSQDDTVEGVYEAIGTKFENEEVERKWREKNLPIITTVKKHIEPEKLFGILTMGNIGHFSGDGLVVKKEVFDKAGLFNEGLRISQDTHMWFRIAAVSKLVPGDIKKPVAIRRVHEKNRFDKATPEEIKNTKLKFYSSLLEWGQNKNLASNKMAFIYYTYFFNKKYIKHRFQKKYRRIINRLSSVIFFTLSHSPFLSAQIIKFYSENLFFKLKTKVKALIPVLPKKLK
jgi:glycosyltransferase involved in cell wall biosynthesis